jgi:sugar (pentulose or hexulose) kinase
MKVILALDAGTTNVKAILASTNLYIASSQPDANNHS